MADVIFSGTDSRKPVGFAEVSLTFTDCGQELGVDWHDVRVTRRVYRDGNSEYLLNKTVCRLKDIQSLFADTGVGRSAYSIMEQGKIDLILSSRPEDRRTVFEEAAGITKYKGQKKEALRKLEATEANLLRIGDIIKEVKRQIGSLQRQAGKARRYQTLMADLQVLDTHHSRGKLEQLEAELAQCREAIGRFEEAERATLAKIEASENEFADKRAALDAIDSRIGDARAEVQRLHSEMSAHRSRIEFNRQRAEEINELITRYRNDIAAAETKRTEQATQIEEADALIEKTNALLEAKQAELAELTAALDRAADRTRGARKRIADLAALALESREPHGGVARRTRRHQDPPRSDPRPHFRTRGRDQRRNRRARSRRRRPSIARRPRATPNNKRSRVFSKRCAPPKCSCKRISRNLADAEKEAFRIERAVAEKQSRLEILQQLNDEGEGLAQGSQAVLKGLDDPERIRPALAGALVSGLDVEREFVPAIEAAFGRNLHAVVLQDAGLASEILRHVAGNKLGQAALALPELTAIGSDDHLVDLAARRDAPGRSTK